MSPCKKCGVTDRNSQGGCRPCAKIYLQAYYQSHKSQAKTNSRNRTQGLADGTLKRPSHPCTKCGSSERGKYGHCLPCGAARNLKRYHADKPKAKAYKHAQYLSNKDKVNADSKAWAKANPDKRDDATERRRLKKYGLTVEQHQALFEIQGGLCLICNESFGKRVHIDHDHSTGRVRGLLCHTCNVGLGHFKDSSALLRKAAEYLEGHQPTDFVVPSPVIKVFQPSDGRYKITDAVRSQIKVLREQGLSLGVIAKTVELSRSTVQVILKEVRH